MSAAEAIGAPRVVPGSAAAPGAERGEFAWRILILLNAFRLIIGLLLLTVFVLVEQVDIVGQTHPELAGTALLAMIVFATVEIFLLRRRFLGAAVHTYLQFTADLCIILLLMHASGGIPSGFAGLLIVSVGSLALLVGARRAFFLAALTTLGLLLQQTVAATQGITDTTHYAPAGILGAAAFVITAVVQLLRRRLVETEALAEQRGVDLRNLSELSEYIVQNLRESIVVVDGDDCVRLLNPSAASHLGAGEAGAGQRLDAISPQLAERLRDWRWRMEADKQAGPIASADGSTSVVPHFARFGSSRSGGVLIFLEDTSLIDERVQQSKLAALGRLSASIAHEIRNPIGAMSHAGQLLAESPSMGADEQRLTEIIRVNSQRVSQIVDSVLSLSRRDKARPERLQLLPWTEDFAREFVQTLELYEGAVTAKGNLPGLEIDMDPTHLHQIVWNLCDNAVKYASAAAGAIAVELTSGRLESGGRPYLEVADSGPGIEPGKVEQIFEPFYTGQPGGTGLGLYISRELCERSGASLRYHPRPGGGSIFRIVFADPTRWQASESRA